MINEIVLAMISGFFSKIGEKLFERGGSLRRVSRSARSPWLRDIFSSNNDLSSSDLIDFYRGEDRIEVQIQRSKRAWTFAAALAIKPVSHGKISEQNIFFKPQLGTFQLDPILDAKTQPLLQKVECAANKFGFYNGKPWRIIDIEERANQFLIRSERCNYFDSLRTSFALGSGFITRT